MGEEFDPGAAEGGEGAASQGTEEAAGQPAKAPPGPQSYTHEQYMAALKQRDEAHTQAWQRALQDKTWWEKNRRHINPEFLGQPREMPRGGPKTAEERLAEIEQAIAKRDKQDQDTREQSEHTENLGNLDRSVAEVVRGQAIGKDGHPAQNLLYFLTRGTALRDSNIPLADLAAQSAALIEKTFSAWHEAKLKLVGGARKLRPLTGGASTGGNAGKEPKTMEEADQMAMERIQALMEGQQ